MTDPEENHDYPTFDNMPEQVGEFLEKISRRLKEIEQQVHERGELLREMIRAQVERDLGKKGSDPPATREVIDRVLGRIDLDPGIDPTEVDHDPIELAVEVEQRLKKAKRHAQLAERVIQAAARIAINRVIP